ncbi:unnamed protein product [Protopolystoma xenopodis]|uniref:Uncharacterized protein n=1 Tax=Protopolystoma xenopodis TaxID=117903 RepID=A0A3S5A614_9PLAT|nr:unnamed protein product [Protopolystoma xenopodis]
MTKLRRGDTGDAGETSGNVPRPRSYSGNDAADNGPRTRCVPISLSTNMTSFENTSYQYDHVAKTRSNKLYTTKGDCDHFLPI